jgi:hypothetical protein
MLLADDVLTLAELQTSHCGYRDPIWLVAAINDADFGRGRRIRLLCITGDVGMQILVAGAIVAAKFNNKPMWERNDKEPADTQQQNSPSRVWCFINCRMLVCGQTETHKCVKKATLTGTMTAGADDLCPVPKTTKHCPQQ